MDAAGGARKKARFVARDEFVKHEHSRMETQSRTVWREAARRDTLLPTVEKDGQVSHQPRVSVIPAVVEKEETGVEVVTTPKLGYSACSKWMSVGQRTELTKMDNEWNHLSLIDFLQKADEIGQKILEDPQSHMYKLECVFTRMFRYQTRYTKCSDLTELEDHCKSYILLFVVIGKIFVHTLPSYVVVEQSNEVSKKMSRHYDLLCVHLYEKWLTRCLQPLVFSDQYVVTKPDICEHVCGVVSELLPAARNFNMRDLYLSCTLNLLAKTNSSRLFNELALAVEQDVNLSLAAALVPMVVKRAYQKAEAKNAADTNSHERVIGRTMRLLDHMHIERKERSALNEMQRKGVTEKQILGKKKSETEKNLQRDLTLGLVSGDLSRFRENKKLILETMLELFVKLLRNPLNHSLECVYETLRSMSRHANLINLEMSQELFNELKNLATTVFTTKKYNNSAPCLALAAVLAAVELISMSHKDSEVLIESDVQWIVPVVVKSVSLIFPFARTNAAEDGDVDYMDRLSVDTQESLSVKDLHEILEALVHSRRALGASAERNSQLAKCPKATSLFVTLKSVCALASRTALTNSLNGIADAIFRSYPSLQSALDEEGIVLDTLTPPQTVAWSNHLLKSSLLQ